MLVLIAGVLGVPAQDSLDDASDAAYADGFQDGDNGGSNFSPWDVTTQSLGPGSTSVAMAVTSAIVGGDPSMNVGGRCWILRSIDDSASIPTALAVRDFPALPVGGKIQFRAQSLAGAMPGWGISVSSGASLLFGFTHVTGTGNWHVLGGLAGSNDTGIPGASPVRVTITHRAGDTFDIEVVELVAPNRTHAQTGLPYDEVGMAPSRLAFGTGEPEPVEHALLFNALIINPDGTLPVELSGFAVE